MAFLGVEDLTSSMEVIVFPKVLTEADEVAREGTPVIIKGTLSLREDEEPKILAEEIRILPSTAPSKQKVRIILSKETAKNLDAFYPVVMAAKGEGALIFDFEGASHTARFTVRADEAFLKKAAAFFGEKNIKTE